MITKLCYIKAVTKYHLHITTNIFTYTHDFVARLISSKFIIAQVDKSTLDFIFSKQFWVFLVFVNINLIEP